MSMPKRSRERSKIPAFFALYGNIIDRIFAMRTMCLEN